MAPRRSSSSFAEVLRVPNAAPTVTDWRRSATSTRWSLTHSALPSASKRKSARAGSAIAAATPACALVLHRLTSVSRI